jgi:hypothetical protein
MPIERAYRGDLEPVRSRGLEVSFQLHAVTYVVVNIMLVLIWLASAGGGYFWPVWPIICWFPGLAIHGWLTYGRVRG